MVGAATFVGAAGVLARWVDDEKRQSQLLDDESSATNARKQSGGLRFHDRRHSYATWLLDDG